MMLKRRPEAAFFFVVLVIIIIYTVIKNKNKTQKLYDMKYNIYNLTRESVSGDGPLFPALIPNCHTELANGRASY